MNDEQERQLERSISRTIAFLTKIFFMVAGVIDRRVLLSESKVGGERLLRFCFQEDLSNELLERESAFASEESVRAMKSHNHCVFVCKLLAGLLAWLTGELRLPFSTQEVDLRGVIETEPVVCVDVMTDKRIKIAAIHTMLEITFTHNDSGGVYLDASAPQYLRPAGACPIKDYPVDPRLAAVRPIHPSPLGGAYFDQLMTLQDSEASSSQSSASSPNFRLEAVIRTVNNEVYKKLTEHDWRVIIKGDDDTKWISLEQAVLAYVKGKLLVLAGHLDDSRFPDGFGTESQHRLMARLCMGTGHWNMMTSLERFSRVPVTLYQDF